MNIKLYTDTRRVNKNGEYSVLISINRDGYRFYVNTGLTTPEKLVGREFPKTVPNFRTKTNALNSLFLKVEEYCLLHQFEPGLELRNGLFEYLSGKPRKVRGRKLIDVLNEYKEVKDICDSRQNSINSSIKWIREFQENVCIEEINEQWMIDFEKKLKKNLASTSIETYLRNVMCGLHYAKRKKYITDIDLGDFKIKKGKTYIRDLTIEQIKQLRDCELPPDIAVFRDLMMLSFYLCGVNMIDLYNATGLTDGRFVCERSKTGVLIDLPVFPEAMELIERLKGKKRLLFMSEKYTSYASFYNILSNNVKKRIGTITKGTGKIGRKKNVYHPIFGDFPLTFYSMRYSFASIAAELEIPRDYIDVCLAHTFQDVNSHYIRYKRKTIDAAIRKVLDAIK